MPQLPNAKLLQAFEATARHSSIATAAKELFITQSALSRQIKAIENLLSLELFVRQKNKLTLTDVGRTLYGEVSRTTVMTVNSLAFSAHDSCPSPKPPFGEKGAYPMQGLDGNLDQPPFSGEFGVKQTLHDIRH